MSSDGREGGFIKLHRQLESWPLWRGMTANQRMVWIQILFLANWKDDSFWYGKHRVEVRRGQLAHSEKVIAKRAGVSRKVVRDALAKLIAEGAVTREVGREVGSGRAEVGHESGPMEGQAPHVTTIVNYDKFQSYDDDEGQAQGQARARVGPGEGPARALREEVEEREEGKNLPPARTARLGIGHPAWVVVQHWTDRVWPCLSPSPCSPVTARQAQQLAQLAGQHTPAEVTARMDRAAADPFWRDKLSLDDFLAKFDRFAPRNATGPPKRAGVAEVGTDWNAKL